MRNLQASLDAAHLLRELFPNKRAYVTQNIPPDEEWQSSSWAGMYYGRNFPFSSCIVFSNEEEVRLFHREFQTCEVGSH